MSNTVPDVVESAHSFATSDTHGDMSQDGSILNVSSMPSHAPFDLTVPEGMDWNEGMSASFSDQARELNLDKDGAQKLLDMSHKNQLLAVEAHTKQVAEWKEQVRTDKELGGAAFERTVSYAKATLSRFDKEGKLLNMLEKTGYSNNPDVIRFLAAVGKEHAEDSVAFGRGSYAAVPRHERMYGKYNN